MKDRIFLLTILLFLFAFQLSYSQYDHEYFGAVKLNDSALISYKVMFSEKDGLVDGYSITDLGGNHETKSKISGTYNSDIKQIFFKEEGIEYTKSPVTQKDFCFIHFIGKSFKLNKTKLLKGNFEGKFSNDTKCIDGEIILTLKSKVDKRLGRITRKINKTKRITDSIKEMINPIKMMDSLNMNILRKNEILSVFVKSDTLELIIYDGGKEDGDKVSLYYDDKLILKSFEIKNNKKIIPLKITSKKHTFKIKALNNGSISPNTMSVKVKVDGKIIDLLSNLNEGDSSQIDFLKSKL